MSNDILTLEIAEQFLEDPDSISFGCYTSIEDAAAESLSKYQGNLNLYGLTELSDAAAESLSKHKGATLDLTGLTEFSDSAAEALAKYRGCLYDGGLIQKNEHDDSEIGISSANVLTPEIAEQFLEDPESIELHEFTVVDEAAAEILAGYDGYLNLSGLKEISQEVAGHLGIKLVKDVRTDNEELSIEGIKKLEDIESCVVGHLEHCLDYNDQSGIYFTDAEGNRKYGYAEVKFSVCDAEDEFAESETITEEIARILVSSKDETLTHYCSEIEDEAAEILANYNGNLQLDGLTELSDAAAEALGKHQGDLWLSGLTELSDAAAEGLFKHQGALLLDGLTELSDDAAEALRKHQGELSVSGLTELSDDAAEALGKHQGPLRLYGLTELSDAAAEALAVHENLVVSGEIQEQIKLYQKT